MATKRNPLGVLADRLYKIKNEKAALARKVEVLDEERKQIEGQLITALPKDDATGVQGKLARVSVKVSVIGHVSDWDALQAHIKKTGSWDLLTRAVKQSAIQERWEDGKKIPGVVEFDKVSVSLNKI